MQIKRLNSILQIDDHKFTNILYEGIIDDLGCSRHFVCKRTAEQAISYLKLRDDDFVVPDLIFLDIDMPGMSGWEFLEIFKTLPEDIAQHTKVVMMSHSLNPEDKDRGLRHPYVSEYASKPLSYEKIEGILQRLFTKKNSPSV